MSGQLLLFEQHLPDKPWCSDDDHGRYPRVLPRNAAAKAPPAYPATTAVAARLDGVRRGP